jgi:hypothetical protein
MTFQPAHNMRDVVQKPEPRCLHQTMSGCVNVTAYDGDCCHAGGMAGAMLRQDMDRIDAIMIVRSGRSRLWPGPQQAACHGKHRSGKTGISLDFIWTSSFPATAG